MNSKDFKTIVDNCIANINSVLANKSREYSSKDNKLHNFEQAQKIMRCNTKEYALWGMFAKHLVSITDMVEKYEKYGILPDENMVEEKIGDGINYFVLLKACFLEDIYNAIEKKKNEKIQAPKEFADKIKECPERAMSLTEIFKQNEGAIANSMYQNPRKRLVVEKLRKMLKPMFVYLTDNNKFIDYEKIKGILNRAELERDSVPDDFIEDVICVMETLVFPPNEYQIREELVTSIIQAMMQPKYKCGEIVWYLYKDLNGIWKMGGDMTIAQFGLFLDVKHAIYCKSIFDEIVYEKDCFKTREEAQQECNNRNNTNAAK